MNLFVICFIRINRKKCDYYFLISNLQSVPKNYLVENIFNFFTLKNDLKNHEALDAIEFLIYLFLIPTLMIAKISVRKSKLIFN